ncbi:MAG: DUF4298 domain-containing protein [Lachnospiraceae bacterium]|nr:DUF4298 domain-containing protein [Lachnospiraceae bacterium]
MDFDRFVKDIKDNHWNVFGVEVYQDGELKYRYGDTCNLHEIYSATKAVLSIAVGILYDEGLIDLDHPITAYLPEDTCRSLSREQYERFCRVTVRRLLTMSVKGFPFRPDDSDNWLDFALSCKIEDPEQAEFAYGNLPPFLVGVALTNILGSDLGAFIEKRIFTPMDITAFEYGRAPEGYFYGASKMRLSVHDLSKFGLLFYNKGVYNGKRILSEEYAGLATSTQQMNREGGYGFYIWRYRGGFSINGKWKQKCYVLPQKGLIITYLAHIEDDSHDLLESMEKNLLGIGQREKEAFERIAGMEERFDSVRAGNGTVEDKAALEAYYTSKDWRFDFELDEAGLLPAGLKRGVLSEDGLFDLLEEVQ